MGMMTCVYMLTYRETRVKRKSLQGDEDTRKEDRW